MNRKSRYASFGHGIALLGTMLMNTEPVIAQNAPTQAASGPATADAEIQEVIVTASRRAETIQEVPSEVNAITGNQLEALNARSFDEFANFIPGVSFTSVPGSAFIAIRGVTSGSQASTAVGNYLDDVPLGSSNSFAGGYNSLSVNTFDMERIEVLSGPQGTLYGANSLGGAVKYVTARPNLDSFSVLAEAEGSQTEHGSLNDGLRAMVNLPLIDNHLALRLVGIQQYDSGYAQDPTHGREDQGAGRTDGGRASLLFQANDDFNVVLNGFYQKVTTYGSGVVTRDPVTRQPNEGTFDQDYPLFQTSGNGQSVISATVNWDLHWANFTSISAYQHSNYTATADISEQYSALLGGLFGPAGINPYGTFTTIALKKYSEELRLVSESNKTFEWVLGAFFTKEDAQTAINIYDANTPNGYLFGIPMFNAGIPTDYNEGSIFADGTYYFTPQLDLTLGVRYSHDRQQFAQDSYGLFNNPAAPFTTTATSAKSSENVVTYLVNPKYEFNESVTAYLRAASGYRPGGPNYHLSLGGGASNFDPDKLWTYEGGLKFDMLNHRLQIDGALYDTQWSKIQLQTTIGGVSVLENAGDARIRGVDLAANYLVTKGFSLNSSVSFIDARLTTAAPAIGVDYSDARLPLSPRWAFAIAMNYDVPLWQDNVGTLTLTNRYVGSRTDGYLGSPNNPLYDLRSYNTVDGNFRLSFSRNVELDLYVKNMFDTRGETTGYVDPYAPADPAVVSLTRPRTVGIETKVRW